jgi:adenosylhomocysteine nucleosidase
MPSGDDGPLTAIVAAMPEELGPLSKRITRRTTWRIGRARVTSGRLGRHPVVVASTGEGEQLARATTSELLRVLPVRRLLVTGVAGALSLGLHPRALVIADQVRRQGQKGDGDGEEFRSSPSLVEWAARACGARRGRVITTSAIAATVVAKAALDERFGDQGPAVVDLESAAYAGTAEASGVPWLVLRAVADTAEESLPALLEQCRDRDGGIRRFQVAGALLRDPRSLWLLLEMRRRVAECAAVLARAVLSLLDAWPVGVEIRTRARTRIMEEPL